MDPETAIISDFGQIPPPPEMGLGQLVPVAPPGYRLGAKLGAGGMGVVYAATQLSLGRDVAIKFLAVGEWANDERVTRFRTEAETIGRIRHPHVVQVIEAGEHAGRPFLVLELIAGGSLSESLASGPLPTRLAADLLVKLAAAVQAAHDQGIVHRDLKPANVLLATGPRAANPSDPTKASGSAMPSHANSAIGIDPKVTDFGLAKWVTGESAGVSDPTRTGAVLGTPSYMAPEQATGDGKRAGPPADIYSLGAILYECLTGRPPFRAAGVLETLDLVRHADPVPPRSLQPGVPRDLETICLKCLRKEPIGRYASAALLAADLGAFLAGKPIAARPVGPAVRFAKWCRRQPALASLLAVGLFGVAAAGAGLAVHQQRLQKALDDKTFEEKKARDERDRADANYRTARDAVRKMLAQTTDSRYRDVPRLRELHAAQADNALAYFHAVAANRDDPSPEVRADAAAADLEAGLLAREVGRQDFARDALGRARDGYTRLIAEFATDRRYRREYCHATLNYANAIAKDPTRADEALRLTTEVVTILNAMVAEPEAPPDLGHDLANANNAMGSLHFHRHQYAESIPYFRAAYDRRSTLVAADPNDRQAATKLAENALNLSMICALAKQPGSEQFNDRAESILEGLVAADPSNRDAACSLANNRVNWSYTLRSKGRNSEAIELLSKSIPILEPMYRLEPNDSLIRNALFNTHGARAELYELLGRYELTMMDREKVVVYAIPKDRQFHRWFLLRSRVIARLLPIALAEAEDILRAVKDGTAANELLHGAQSCAILSVCFNQVAAVAPPAASAADRAGRIAVLFLAKMSPTDRVGLDKDSLLQPLVARDDFRELFMK